MAQKQTRWRKLDNTANLFPVIPGRAGQQCVPPFGRIARRGRRRAAQRGAGGRAARQRVFGMRLRHGLFWNYLEQNDAPAAAVREQEAPCRAIDTLETNRYLFRVLYFGARISLETYHALTDGTGALRFLQALCYRYCQLRYAAELPAGALAARYGAEQALNVQDGYLRSYLPQKAKKTYREPRAFRLRGERRMPFDMGVCTLLMPCAAPARSVPRAGRERGRDAHGGGAHGRARGVPARARGKAARRRVRPRGFAARVRVRYSANFFAGVTVREHFGEAQRPFGDVLASVRVQLAEKTTREALAQKLAYTARGELNFAARLAPLPLKNGRAAPDLRGLQRRRHADGVKPRARVGGARVRAVYPKHAVFAVRDKGRAGEVRGRHLQGYSGRHRDKPAGGAGRRAQYGAPPRARGRAGDCGKCR